jgi:hypothetical protein
MRVIGEQSIHAAEILQSLEREDASGFKSSISRVERQLTSLFPAPINVHGQRVQAGPRLGLSVTRLIEHSMQTGELAPSPLLEHVRRNAEARDRFIAEHGGLLSSQEVAEIARSTAANKSQIAHRWRKEAQIFAVEHRGVTCYPALQFDADNGRPLTVVKDLIDVLGRYYDGWALALWFVTAHAWLNDKRPIDLLKRNPRKVLEAAQQEMHALDD